MPLSEKKPQAHQMLLYHNYEFRTQYKQFMTIKNLHLVALTWAKKMVLNCRFRIFWLHTPLGVAISNSKLANAVRTTASACNKLGTRTAVTFSRASACQSSRGRGRLEKASHTLLGNASAIDSWSFLNWREIRKLARYCYISRKLAL